MKVCHNARGCILHTSLLLFIPLKLLHSQSFLPPDSQLARQRVKKSTPGPTSPHHYSPLPASPVKRLRWWHESPVTIKLPSFTQGTMSNIVKHVNETFSVGASLGGQKTEKTKTKRPAANTTLHVENEMQNASSLSCTLVARKPKAGACWAGHECDIGYIKQCITMPDVLKHLSSGNAPWIWKFQTKRRPQWRVWTSACKITIDTVPFRPATGRAYIGQFPWFPNVFKSTRYFIECCPH